MFHCQGQNLICLDGIIPKAEIAAQLPHLIGIHCGNERVNGFGAIEKFLALDHCNWWHLPMDFGAGLAQDLQERLLPMGNNAMDQAKNPLNLRCR